MDKKKNNFKLKVKYFLRNTGILLITAIVVILLLVSPLIKYNRLKDVLGSDMSFIEYLLFFD